MNQVSLEDLENRPIAADVTKRATGPLSLSNMAINYYELAPGDVFSTGMHTHMNQEEVFLVLEGTSTFETEDGIIEVGPHEVIRFAPGEYQQGRNEGDERVRAVGFGAPREMGETRTPLTCRECGAEYHTVDTNPENMVLNCPECGNSFSV